VPPSSNNNLLRKYIYSLGIDQPLKEPLPE
jgi:hypothetical protein